MDEVAQIMGTPSSVQQLPGEVWWHYGASRVTFSNGRVAGWDNASNNLRVRWVASIAKNADQKHSNELTQSGLKNAEARKIDAEVDAILAGQHSPLPPAQHVRPDPYARVATMAIQNNTGHTLTVQYSGPSSQQMVLEPHEKRTITLAIGAYKVAATVNSPSVLPYAGRDTLSGGQYQNTFNIETVRL